jgi:glyoxylase-like metal-dependent hydrolase (beta-lactamase superfamily II)
MMTWHFGDAATASAVQNPMPVFAPTSCQAICTDYSIEIRTRDEDNSFVCGHFKWVLWWALYLKVKNESLTSFNRN